MADRVPFLCRVDGGPPFTSGSGCNGFPFPYNYAGSDAQHPIAVSFQTCMKWWWRVAQWSVSTDVGMVDTLGNSYNIPSGTLGGTAGTRELDLINPLTQHLFQTTTPGPAITFDFIGGPTAINTDLTNYFPILGLSGGAASDATPTTEAISISFGDFGLPGSPSFVGSIDGLPITVFYDAVTFAPASFTASSLILTPLSFWPYAARDGSPIYDTLTGAQLQNPTN